MRDPMLASLLVLSLTTLGRDAAAEDLVISGGTIIAFDETSATGPRVACALMTPGDAAAADCASPAEGQATASRAMPLPPINPGPRPPADEGPKTFANDGMAVTVTSNILSITRGGQTWRGAVTKRYGDRWHGYFDVAGTFVAVMAVQTDRCLTLEIDGATSELLAKPTSPPGGPKSTRP